MPIFNNILAGSSGQATGYEIEKSVVLGDSAYFSRTPSSAGNRQVFTISAWVKLGSAAADDKSIALMAEYTDDNNRGYITFGSYCRVFSRGSGSDIANYSTDATFRDPSAWYHVVFSIDVTQSTAANRVKIYVNGIQQDITISSNFPEDTDTRYNVSGREYHIGKLGGGAGIEYADGYVAEYHFIDGTALDASSFGETNSDTNQWVPIEYTGSYGTNGFYLDFATRATDPIDASGNGNNWSSSNVVSTDWRIDSPTNNFATLNPLAPPRASGSFTYSEGNLKVSMGGSGDADCPSTMGASSGKWYAEAYILTGDQSTNTPFLGLVSSKFLDNETIASSSNSCVYYYSGSKRVNGTVSSYGATYNAGDIVGIAFNADDNEVTFYKNNSTQGAISLTADEYVFSSGKSAGTPVLVWNFGQDSSFSGNKTSGAAGSDFYYTPPTGFKALSTANLSDPSIADPTAYFDTTLVSGNGSNRSITGLNFQPDFLWGKSRTNTLNHYLTDSVRGVNSQLYSDATGSEGTETVIYTAFNSDGFSLGTGDMNLSGQNYVHWAWKAGGTASSNTDGSITSSVSANTTAGFSIVAWTGTGSNVTVGHGLSQAPDLIINKSRDDAYNWAVQSILFNSASDTNLLYLNTTAAAADDTNVFQAAPTATVFSPQGGSWSGIGASGVDYIAYCFHSVDGYSKIGTYQGNGNNDGPFIYTGFQPAFFLVKKYETVGGDNWAIYDNKRNETNVMNTQIYPDANSAEESSSARNIDFVSNGIKIRGTNSRTNDASTHSFLYMAFAEFPFKTSNAR